jgi:hypothetical protein
MFGVAKSEVGYGTAAIAADGLEDVRRSFPDGGNSKPFVVEMEVLVGSGRK